jgi:hypothetical protein
LPDSKGGALRSLRGGMVFGEVRGPGFWGSRPSYVVALGGSSTLA